MVGTLGTDLKHFLRFKVRTQTPGFDVHSLKNVMVTRSSIA